MKRLRVIECPICGHLNRNLDIADSKGWMECEHCGALGIIPEISEDIFETYKNSTIRYFKPINQIRTGAVS